MIMPGSPSESGGTASEGPEKPRWPSRRAEAASETHTRYPRWTDEDGLSRAFTTHPNYQVIRHLRGWLLRDCGPEYLWEPWHDLHKFVVGVTAVVGVRPSKHHRLETIHRGDVFGPDTVLWWCETWAKTRIAQRALRRRARTDLIASFLYAGQLNRPDDAARVRARQREAAWQRAEQRGLEPCDCTRIYECDEHAAARRAGD